MEVVFVQPGLVFLKLKNSQLGACSWLNMYKTLPQLEVDQIGSSTSMQVRLGLSAKNKDILTLFPFLRFKQVRNTLLAQFKSIKAHDYLHLNL